MSYIKIMTNYYTTGSFANLANVTERTIRYYDKIGLLKPSFVMKNGYRQYNDNDFVKLQKILFLKQLGFTIEEIYPLVNADESLSDSIKLQIDLVNHQIDHYISLKDSLKTIQKLVDKSSLNNENVLELIRLTNLERSIVEQYKNENNLKVRIQLHRLFSINKQGWYNWLISKIQPEKFNRILELGCGDGTLWKEVHLSIRNREVYLTDISEGMISSVRKRYGKDFNCLAVDCEQIPFKDSNFDCIIANHVLFYVNDLELGLSEINRALSENGIFYCSTYGIYHMKELSTLVKEFDERIELSEQNLVERFGIENGDAILQKYFEDITLYKYEDSLQIDEVQPLMDYILSCHGNQNEIIGKRLEEFKSFLNDKLKKNDYITITKNAGLFICKK